MEEEENNDSGEDNQEEKENKSSKYNSGVDIIQRLDSLWTDSHRLAKSGKLMDWNWTLDRVWCELSGDLESDDTRIGKFSQFETDIENLKVEFIRYRIETVFMKKLYNKIMDKELFLRRLQNKLGKGTAYKRDDEDDMD